MTQTFDAIVIGAGQAGPSLHSRLPRSGRKVDPIRRLKVRRRAATVTANSSIGVENWLRNMKGCTVFHGSAQFEGPKEVRVGAELLSAPRLFINVGGGGVC